MTSSPPKIDLLPEHLIDQIKAGEVIERPGNLIKEILENAVDAGSTRLELHIKNNGLDLISLKDNGHGMRLNDLPLAFSRHATSKISRFEDLYKLRSFGFRGEALASIASISKLQCISYTSPTDGSEIRIEGGLTTFHGKRQTSSTVGTELVIQDLFFNTPARLKFIQSQQSEKQFIRRIVFSFILSHPQIEFLIKFEDAEKEIFPKAENLLDRITSLAPKASGQILRSERFYENTELEVFLIPGHYKTPVKIQNVFINDRFILDKQIHRVMSNALQSAFGDDNWQYIAYFSLPSETIDVNVHPNKTIIKCMDNSKMLSLLTSTIKELAAPRKALGVTPETPVNDNLFSNFETSPEAPTLLQERHHYNMEGLFSPHGLNLKETDSILWIENFFLYKLEGKFWAFNAQSLLEHYILNKIKKEAITIPLMVSEPYEAKGISLERIKLLNECGIELEFLGKETLVLRGIPEWMNGFPLRLIIGPLLKNESFNSVEINPADWAESTWDEMINSLEFSDLVSEKIAVNLHELLSQRLK